MFTSATCLGCSLRMRQFSLIYRPYDADLLHLPHVWNAYCACANADFLFTYRTDDADILHLSHVWNAYCACANADFLFIYRTMMLTFFICQMFGMFGAHASMLILFYLQNRWCWPSSSATCSGCPAHARTLSSMAFSTTTLPREGGNKQ